MDVLVVDVGGTHVKLRTSNAAESRRFDSGPTLTPAALIDRVQAIAGDWTYDCVALGYPGAVHPTGPAAEPGNLGYGWVDFNFEEAFGRPVRVVNDAVLHALGAYNSGRMLFMGLGTGIASALVTEHVVVPLEIGCLPHVFGGSMAERLGREGLERHGQADWQQALEAIVPILQGTFTADYIVLGGGHAALVDPLPLHTRRGGNDDAFVGGLRLWEEVVEPLDRRSPPVWRVVR